MISKSLHNIHLELFTANTKTSFKRGFLGSLMSNINYPQICFEKDNKYVS